MRNLENILTLIRGGGSGYFTLHDEFMQQNFGSRPVTEDEAKGTDARKLNPADLAAELAAMVEQLGDGRYKVLLRANSKATKSDAISYAFQVGELAAALTPQAGRSAGIGLVELENIKKTHADSEIEREKRIWELEKKFEQLEVKTAHEKEIAGLKEKAKEKKDMITEALPAITAGVIGLVGKFAPEALGTVEKALGMFTEGDETETAEVTTRKVIRED